MRKLSDALHPPYRRINSSFSYRGTLSFVLLSVLLGNSESIAKSTARAANQPSTIDVVDFASVSIEAPNQAIKSISNKKPNKIIDCDILIAGGGLGGIAAAMKIWNLSQSSTFGPPSRLKIVITEETDWLGGQVTSQGNSALDDNSLVETSGASERYQTFRNVIRSYYQNNYKLSAEAASERHFNPGSCWVGSLSFEPKAPLSPFAFVSQFHGPVPKDLDHLAVKEFPLEILKRHKIFKVIHTGEQSHTHGHLVKEVYTANLDTGETVRLKPKICLDATDLGDILPLAGLPYSCGAESRSQTGEPHAPPIANPDNVQDFTYPFVLELTESQDHKIKMPPHYIEFKSEGKFSFHGYKMFESVPYDTGNSTRLRLPFWEYRRIIDARQFNDPAYPHDLALVNWASNDLRGKNIIDVPPSVQAERLALAKSLSLGFLYWLQNEAPRDEGGFGYPELLLRKDVLGTVDGLSKHPYIRESRRALTYHTIVEQDIVAAWNPGPRAKISQDSIGIGRYPVDIHGHQDVPGVWQPTRPFQIPLGALIPSVATNVLPACKNIGTTHITNGAYRLHPIEFAIGEAQGALALLALKRKIQPIEIVTDLTKLRLLQRTLVESGVPIYWYDDVATDHPQFKAIQYLAVCDILKGSPDSLHFEPDRPITRAESAVAIARALFPSPLSSTENKFADKVADLSGFEYAKPAIEACLSKSLMLVDANNNFRPSEPLASIELEFVAQDRLLRKLSDIHSPIPRFTPSTTVPRSQFAAWLYQIVTAKRYKGHP